MATLNIQKQLFTTKRRIARHGRFFFLRALRCENLFLKQGGIHQKGFTLLEVLIVLLILGLLAAMALPAMGLIDNAERTRITNERMNRIRTAIIGKDGAPRPGGYVGDMKVWPDLWEGRAEIRPDGDADAWENPGSIPVGYGQGPDYTMDDDLVFYRPSGSFVKDRWVWNTPYRKLTDDTTSNDDHIGGLETENEGQPRGLWTRYPEELNFDIGTHTAPGEDLGDDWKGPYLTPPVEENLANGKQWAEEDSGYEALMPVPDAYYDTDKNMWIPTWEDGDYSPSDGELGELFDEKESFRMLQTDGCLTDGWGRALRFFITDDPDCDGSTIFWIVSEGPDKEGVYPNKGTCSGHSWSVDADDVMSTVYDESEADPRGYNENADENLDNIVMKLYSRDWEALFEEETESLTSETEDILARIRRALLGDSPGGENTGYTGDMTAWPALFRWEDGGTTDHETDDGWDDENEETTPVAYTKGQPRGLWTDTPNSLDSTDDLESSLWGLGRRRAYISPPPECGENERLTDAWGREVLFFRDEANGLLLILSRGADGKFDFGDVDDDYEAPEDFTETVDATTYDPTATYNEDNRHLLLADTDFSPGFFTLTGFTVTGAVLGDATDGTTKARFFRTGDEVITDVDLLVPTVLTDEDGDGTADDWAVGDGTTADPAFNFDDTTTYEVPTGARYLVFWNDADDDGEIDSGEYYYSMIFSITAVAGSGQHDAIDIDTSSFREMP